MSKGNSLAPALVPLCAALLLAPTPARASGFAIFEQGAQGMGFAGAFTAQSDPSSIFHNAAGIAFLKGKHLYFGGTAIHPASDFTGDDPFPGAGVTEKGDAGVMLPPAADYTHQLSERLVVGVGVHMPYGLRTRWENRDTTFSGRFLSKLAEVRSISINPTVAYKLADRLAIGGGLDVRLSHVTLQRNAASFDPFRLRAVDVAAVELDSDYVTALGFNLGLLAKPTSNLSVGAAYRHKVKADFTGQATFTLIPTGNSQFDALVAASLPTGATPVETAIEFPALLTVGVAYDWQDWTVAADVDFHKWSSFDTLEVNFVERPDLSSRVVEAYKDSRVYRVGLERRLGERWAVRGGYFLDETPSPAESMSPLLPDADRHGLAAGFSYKSGRFRVDVASWYLIFKDRSTQGLQRDRYDGTWKSHAELLAVSLGYGF
jgi:long-chain fatty acid transport protein